MRIDSFHSLAAWLAGLAVTLVLASWLTPRTWWRRPTVLNLGIAVLGAWAFGSLILHGASTPLPHMQRAGLPGAFAPATAPAAGPLPAIAHSMSTSVPRAFRVHRDLNLRAAASVDAQRLALVPAGASVTPTGARSGDWWEVRALADGKSSTGWVSSLWLRRTAE